MCLSTTLQLVRDLHTEIDATLAAYRALRDEINKDRDTKLAAELQTVTAALHTDSADLHDALAESPQ